MSQPAPPLCAKHEAFIYERGGQVIIGKLTDLVSVRWQRIRDSISTAQVRIGPYECCDLMNGTQTIANELHIYRDGELVWAGPITRIEFEWDGIDVFAEDMLWVAKRRALLDNYNFNWPPDGTGPINTIELGRQLLEDRCYAQNGDEWNMVASLNPTFGPDDPMAQRGATKFTTTIWEEFDALGAYYGMDYATVGRAIFWWDINYDWNPLPPLPESDLSDYPRIVEYGNALATRYFFTDGSGYAGIAESPIGASLYGTDIDIISVTQQAAERATIPDAAELAEWKKIAEKQIDRLDRPRESIVIPANATLLSTSTWDINKAMPGSWSFVTVDRICRRLSGYQRLNELRVTEDGTRGEVVQITMITPPATRVTAP